MTYCSVTDDGGYDATRAAVVAELAEIDALPCAEIEPPIGDGESESRPYYDGFYVGWHIVRTFIGVEIIWGVFGDEAVKNCREIVAHIRVGILVESQCRRCVFDQQMQQSFMGYPRELPHDFPGNEMYARGIGRKVISVCSIISMSVIKYITHNTLMSASRCETATATYQSCDGKNGTYTSHHQNTDAPLSL